MTDTAAQRRRSSDDSAALLRNVGVSDNQAQPSADGSPDPAQSALFEPAPAHIASARPDSDAVAELDWIFLAAEDLAPGQCEAPWWLADGFYPGDAAEEAAWRAGLPGDVRASYDAGPYSGEDEAFGPGFTHRDERSSGGTGFAAGGTLDRLEPGAFLAEMLAVATRASEGSDGYTRLGESELVGVLCAWRRLSSWSAAGEAAATVTLARRRAQQGVAPENRHIDEHVADEIAAALTLTGVSALRLLEIAHRLRRLSEVYAALLAGQIDWAKACVFVDELAALDEADARRLAALVLGVAGGLTTGQLRRRLRLLVLAEFPEAAESRKREARKDTRVEVWDEPSGNAALAGRQLHSADVIAIDRQLTATAEWLQSEGAEGTIEALRAAAYTALLAGRDLTALLPDLADPAEPGAVSDPRTSPRGGEEDPSSNARNGKPREGARDDTPDDDARARRAGDGSAPDGSAPDGSAPDGIARSGGACDGGACDGGARNGGTCDDDGRGDHAGSGADDTGRPGAGWPRLTGRINLTMPWSTWAGLSNNAGEAAGYGPQDAATCRDLAGKTDTTTRWCLTLTDEHGRAVAHACARDGPPHGQPAVRWAKGLRAKLEYLQAGSCGHFRQSPAYQTPGRLAHLIRVRQPTCSFPGCRRAAARCDLDHTVPYDQGGRTCECNLAPLCRRHHRAKQVARWRLTQDEPGRLTWQMPHQRSYRTEPEAYPV